MDAHLLSLLLKNYRLNLDINSVENSVNTEIHQ